MHQLIYERCEISEGLSNLSRCSDEFRVSVPLNGLDLSRIFQFSSEIAASPLRPIKATPACPSFHSSCKKRRRLQPRWLSCVCVCVCVYIYIYICPIASGRSTDSPHQRKPNVDFPTIRFLAAPFPYTPLSVGLHCPIYRC